MWPNVYLNITVFTTDLNTQILYELQISLYIFFRFQHMLSFNV